MPDSPPESQKISDLLARLARETGGDRVRLGDLVAALGDRAFGILMLIFALPNAVGLGTIPGLSTVFGLPQIFFAIQMAAGRTKPWLPAWLIGRSLARNDFRAVIDKSMPYLARLEKLLRPRWPALSSPMAERLLGVLFVVLASIVSLPIPFGNQPPAVAVAIIALGLTERDGLYVVIGLAVAVIAVALAAGVILGGAAALYFAITYLFG
ncbi:MAG: exopolysaccharide biosynthesis protein [Rhodospirillales bacterium]|nr:exopolysaccharide biosynthesis protein [Rhodospirillales bacterium]